VDPRLRRIHYRAHAPGGVVLELENVDAWLEGTGYRFVAMAPDGDASTADLDARLQQLARGAGAEKRWTLDRYKAQHRERSL